MKRVYLTLSAAALCTAVSNSHAESDLSVYGKANITLNNIEEESKNPVVDEWQLNSNASHLGVKGRYDINDNFQAIDQMEFESHFDDGQSSSSKDKDIKLFAYYAKIERTDATTSPDDTSFAVGYKLKC